MFRSFILAGGKSSRMKLDKAFLKFGNETLVGHSIRISQKIKCKEIMLTNVIFGKVTEEHYDYPMFIKDIYTNRGVLGGIHSALAHCDEKHTLIFACDYPFISPELLNYLLEIAENENVDCVAPIQKDGIIQPLCAVYKTQKCLKVLTTILKESNKTPSAREFLKKINTKLIDFEEFAEMPNSEYFFFNVNTPEEFKKALEIRKLIDEK